MNFYIPKWVIVLVLAAALIFIIPPTIYMWVAGQTWDAIGSTLLGLWTAAVFVECVQKKPEPRLRLERRR